jgi:hypothetical protein
MTPTPNTPKNKEFGEFFISYYTAQKKVPNPYISW